MTTVKCTTVHPDGHRWNTHIPLFNTADSVCHAPCLSRIVVWPRYSSAPWLALVAGSGDHTQPTGHACHHNTAPLYIARDLRWTDDAQALQRLRSGSRQQLIVQRMWLHMIGDRSFRVTAARHGTVFHLVSLQHLHWLCSKDNWKTFLFEQPFSWLYILTMYCVLFCLCQVNLHILIIIIIKVKQTADHTTTVSVYPSWWLRVFDQCLSSLYGFLWLSRQITELLQLCDGVMHPHHSHIHLNAHTIELLLNAGSQMNAGGSDVRVLINADLQ